MSDICLNAAQQHSTEHATLSIGSVVGPGGVLVDIPKIGGTTRVDLVALRGVRRGRELRHVVLARGGVFHAGGWHLVNVHGLVVEVVRMVDDAWFWRSLECRLSRAVTVRRSGSMGQEAIGRWLCSG